MWQPPLNKHLYGNTLSNPYSDNTPPPPPPPPPQDELSANLLHLQKLHLTDLITTPLYRTPNISANLILPNSPTLPTTTPPPPLSPALIHHLQQYLRSRGGCSVPSRTPTAATMVTPSANHPHLLLSSTAADNSTTTYLPPPHTILPPTATASAALPAPATVLDMSLEIFGEALLRLNRLPHRLGQTIPQLLATNNANNSSIPTTSAAHYLSGATLPLPPPPPSSPPTLLTLPLATSNSSHHLMNMFKTYFTLEQQQQLMQQHLLLLNNTVSVNATTATTTTTTTYSSVTSSPIANGYYSASMNLNHLISTSTNPIGPKSSSSLSSSISVQDQQRALRKRREDLKDLFKKPYAYPVTPPNVSNKSSMEAVKSSNSGGDGGCIGEEIADKTTDDLLLPPPKKKWIRHYLKANNHHHHSHHQQQHHHQLHIQNHNNNNNSMMVDDIPPTSNQHSPPRHVSTSLGSSSTGGSHYMQMISTAAAAAAGQQQAMVGAAGSGSNHATHATPRRRTISSTSNGAGTREVHNKLEKNRRAHLKECYEQLKNELSLKDEDRRKTSNLAILGEAFKCVQSLKNRSQEVDAEWEHLANEKINLQKRIVSLKRELGPKYEQIFSGIFPDNEIGSIPNERGENINETHSLASGRGSALYSSSSSLSSGGSSSSNGGSGSNTMSSPVGAGLQTAMPTTISPVINKIINNNHNNVNTITTTTTTSPISISNNNNNNSVVIQQRKNLTNTTTTMQTVAIPATHHISNTGGISISSPQPIAAGSPTALITFGGSSLPLSLTAKNISATAVTRGSPTPSTPSPSPSSSSGVSSSSSLISSSPPINGVISSNGRTVTVNIPNGLKLHAAASANTGTTTATILGTSAPAQGVNNTNNAIMLQALRGCHLV